MKKIQNKINEKGITLIALIVTIIVLIILAAVTIYTLAGENNILNDAKTSKEISRRAEAVEIMTLKLSNLYAHDYIKPKRTLDLQEIANALCDDEDIEYVIKKNKETASLEYIDVSDVTSIYTKLKAYPYEFEIDETLRIKTVRNTEGEEEPDLDKKTYTISVNLNEGLSINNEAKTIEEEAEYKAEVKAQEGYIIETLKVTMREEEITEGIIVLEDKKSGTIDIANVTGNIVITAEAKIEEIKPVEGTLLRNVKANPSAYYGKKVSGYEANGISDWRIFYADNENVFLITTDTVPNGKAVACNPSMRTDGEYGVSWGIAPTVSDTTNAKKFSPATEETIEWKGDYGAQDNVKCVSTLLDTNLWKAFLDKEDGTGKGKMAIGSPTLSMWIASWNTKYPDRKLICTNSNSNGYFLGKDGTTNKVYLSRDWWHVGDGYRNKEKEGFLAGGLGNYWIAAPSSNYPDALFYFTYDFMMYFGLHEVGGCGLRPVVCLRSNVNMISNEEDDVITITD